MMTGKELKGLGNSPLKHLAVKFDRRDELQLKMEVFLNYGFTS